MSMTIRDPLMPETPAEEKEQELRRLRAEVVALRGSRDRMAENARVFAETVSEKQHEIEELRDAALEKAAQLVELEYAADHKAALRLKQIASHIRALKNKP